MFSLCCPKKLGVIAWSLDVDGDADYAAMSTAGRDSDASQQAGAFDGVEARDGAKADSLASRLVEANRLGRAELQVMSRVSTAPRDDRGHCVGSPLLEDGDVPSPSATRAARLELARPPAARRPPPPAPPPPPPAPPPADLLDFGSPPAAEAAPSPMVAMLLANEERIQSERSAAAPSEAARHLFGLERKDEVDAKLKKAGVSPEAVADQIRKCDGALAGAPSLLSIQPPVALS